MTIWRSIAVAATLWLGAAVGTAQQPIFTSRVEGVRIDVLVTEDGTAVTGLGAGDFEVRDNGVPQSIDLVRVGDLPVRVVLTLDASASVGGDRLAVLKRAGRTLIDALGPGDAAALISFNRAVVQRVALTPHLDDVRRALEETEAGGETALIDASLSALLYGDAELDRTLVVVFSDGVDTASFVPPALVLDTAQRVNGVVYGVSTSRDKDPFLEALTSITGGHVLAIGRAADPGPAFLEILQEFRRRYVITFTPSGVDPGGWHSLEVGVNRPRARVRTRRGYFSAQQ